MAERSHSSRNRLHPLDALTLIWLCGAGALTALLLVIS